MTPYFVLTVVHVCYAGAVHVPDALRLDGPRHCARLRLCSRLGVLAFRMGRLHFRGSLFALTIRFDPVSVTSTQ